MYSKILRKLVIAIFFLCLVFTARANASETVDLSDPSLWQFFGTVSKGDTGFLLGDEDGYTEGDSCWNKWFNQVYDYDVALSIVAFKAPLTFKFRAAFDPTDYGYNTISVACLRTDITTDDFFSCTNNPPAYRTNAAVGTRWEVSDHICSGAYHSLPYECIFSGERFNDYEITVDENGYYEVKINGQTLANGTVKCDTGWYVAYAQSFDSQVDFLNGVITASSAAKVEEVLAGGEQTENNETEVGEGNGTETTCQSKIDAAWQEGFEAGKKFCKENPEECGIVQEETQETGEEACMPQECMPTFDFITFSLDIPCLKIGDEYYGVKLGITQTSPQVLMKLLSVKKKHMKK